MIKQAIMLVGGVSFLVVFLTPTSDESEAQSEGVDAPALVRTVASPRKAKVKKADVWDDAGDEAEDEDEFVFGEPTTANGPQEKQTVVKKPVKSRSVKVSPMNEKSHPTPPTAI